jgi:hypothetical protein
MLILTSIDVFPLIIVSPINAHMHHLLLGRGGVFFVKCRQPLMKWKINMRCSTLHSYHSCVRGVSTDYWLDSRGWITGKGKMFLLSTTSRPVLGPTQAPIQWVPGAGSRGVNTFVNYNYLYIMPYLISRVPSFLIESRSTPGISASIYIYKRLYVCGYIQDQLFNPQNR